MLLLNKKKEKNFYRKEFLRKALWIPLGYSQHDCCEYYKCPNCQLVINDYRYPIDPSMDIECECGFRGKLL